LAGGIGMVNKKAKICAWGAVLFLFAQTIASAFLFRKHADGGAWPIVLLVFFVIDMFYARFMLDAAARGAATAWAMVLLTALLSVALLIHSNFWLIFGEDPSLWSNNVRLLQRFFGSGLFPYLIYIIPVVIVELIARRQT
jgi:hypothetical protein